MTNEEFVKEFKKQAASIVDDIEYYPDCRGSSDGEFIIYYNGVCFDVQHYEYEGRLVIDCALTSITYKGRKIEDEYILEWGYGTNSGEYSELSKLVEDLFTEITSCDVKKTFRKVNTVLDSIKEDLSEEEYEVFKILIGYEL